MNQLYAVHAELPKTTVWVKEDIFFDLEQCTDNWIKCTVFGITCLPGKVPAFEILTPEGYVFSDIPPHMLKLSQDTDATQYELTDLVYNNCLSEHFALSQFTELQHRTAFVFLKNKNEYLKAQYWFSLDFYLDNNWFHCMRLENGQIAFIPSHKIVFSTTGQLPLHHVFPAYKKLRHTFKV